MSDSAQWITLLTLIAGFIWQAYRENRQRKWDKEDRAELAEKVVSEAAKVATLVTDEAAMVKAEAADHVAKLTEDIAANTKVSTEAFHEANNVNLKLAALGIEHNMLDAKQKGQP